MNFGNEKKVVFSILLASFLMLNFVSAEAIIADHNAADNFDNIPQYWIDQAKQMFLVYPGESHGIGITAGLNFIEDSNSSYSVQIVAPSATGGDYECGFGENPLVSNPSESTYCAFENSSLVLSRWVYDDSWVGEEDLWTTPGATSNVINYFNDLKSIGRAPNAFAWAWCYDMTDGGNVGGTLDSVYKIHWAGRTENGPNGSTIWGLDSDDESLTNNSLSVQDYIDAMESIAAAHPDVAVIYTTGPVDSIENTGESGYQRELKNNRIREWVVDANGSGETRYLLDYADILSYSDSGSEYTIDWTNPYDNNTVESYGFVNPDNMVTPYDVAHIGEEGTIRLGKATWWLMARIAGWDGVTNSTGSNVSECVSGDTRACGISLGICQTGVQYCVDGSWDNTCVGAVNPGIETCNLLDDDCDGSIDENLGILTCGVGACTNTVSSCINGIEQTCTALNVASSEICGNGIDDDCDGSIDEGCQTTGPFSFSMNLGGNAFIAQDGTIYLAQDGSYITSYENVYTTNPLTSIVNTRDDELYRSQIQGSQIEISIPVPSNGIYQVTLQAAEIESSNSGRKLQASIEGADYPDSCFIFAWDLLAYDFNGASSKKCNATVTDGELNIVVTNTGSSYDAVLSAINVVSLAPIAPPEPECVSGETRACGSNVGECSSGLESCVDGSWDNTCVGAVNPGIETCNLLDDDCDGVVDEDLGTLSCGIGACTNTVSSCMNGIEQVCEPLAPQGNETCGNNIDDDCNGIVDDGCPSVGPFNFAMNLGGNAFIAQDGTIYLAQDDNYLVNYDRTFETSSLTSIVNTRDDTLYQSQIQGSSIEISIPVPSNGVYQVTLQAAEIESSTSTRNLQASIEGADYPDSCFIFAWDLLAYDFNGASTKRCNANVVDGELNIVVTNPGNSYDAVLSAIRINQIS